jgi:hypothetical protein
VASLQPHRCEYYGFSIFCGIMVEEMGWQRLSEGESRDFLRESLRDWPEAEFATSDRKRTPLRRLKLMAMSTRAGNG